MKAGHQDAYAEAGIRIIERDGAAISMELDLEQGTVVVIAEFIRLGDRLVIDGAHVEGEGLDLALIRKFAKVFGQVEDVAEVIVQGGRRTSGRGVGSLPPPIRVKVR